MVTLRENESFESLLKRFNKYVDREEILADYRKNEYFIKPSAKRHELKRKKQREIKRGIV